MKKVYCIGELLIDFISMDKTNSLKSVESFLRSAGGAPANVAVAVKRLGGNSAFLGQVGNDAFGNYLEDLLMENEIDTTNMIKKGNTTLAFVTLDDKGERDFQFNRGVDGDYKLNLSVDEINENSIIHFGSATAFLGGELKESYYKLLEYASEKNAFISFDPNYRDSLIPIDKIEEFKKNCWKFMRKANYIKLSVEEALILTGKEKLEEAIEAILKSQLETVFITLGEVGTLLFNFGQFVLIPSIKVKQKDSTGAGDAFIGAVLYMLSNIENINISIEQLKDIVRFANKVGAITCMGYGGIPSIPTKEIVENYGSMKNV